MKKDLIHQDKRTDTDDEAVGVVNIQLTRLLYGRCTISPTPTASLCRAVKAAVESDVSAWEDELANAGARRVGEVTVKGVRYEYDLCIDEVEDVVDTVSVTEIYGTSPRN